MKLPGRRPRKIAADPNKPWGQTVIERGRTKALYGANVRPNPARRPREKTGPYKARYQRTLLE